MPSEKRPSPVSKAEFVGLLAVLGQLDRVRYRELREVGWIEACAETTRKIGEQIPLSDIPN